MPADKVRDEFSIVSTNDNEADHLIISPAFNKSSSHRLFPVFDLTKLVNQCLANLRKFPDHFLYTIKMPGTNRIGNSNEIRPLSKFKQLPVWSFLKSLPVMATKRSIQLAVNGIYGAIACEKKISFTLSTQIFLDELKSYPSALFVHNIKQGNPLK